MLLARRQAWTTLKDSSSSAYRHTSRTLCAMSGSRRIEYVDIGVNLGDAMFNGRYHGKKAHPPDLNSVLERARKAGVVAQIVTAGDLSEIKDALSLARQNGESFSFQQIVRWLRPSKVENLYSTAGIHPTRTSGVDAKPHYLDDIRKTLDKEARTRNEGGRIVAIGECGLDYDRLHFSSKDVQRTHFPQQLQLAREYGLPLFLHCRAAHEDFLGIMSKEAEDIASACENEDTRLDEHHRKRIGVAHCFTGSVAEMQELTRAGLFVGLTGCSLKEEEGIRVAKEIPLEYLLLETDAPWCDMRPSHASASLLSAFALKEAELSSLYSSPSVKKEKWEQDKQVKSRNEPCAIGNVAAVIAEAKGIEIDTVAKAARDNTRFLFGI